MSGIEGGNPPYVIPIFFLYWRDIPFASSGFCLMSSRSCRNTSSREITFLIGRLLRRIFVFFPSVRLGRIGSLTLRIGSLRCLVWLSYTKTTCRGTAGCLYMWSLLLDVRNCLIYGGVSNLDYFDFSEWLVRPFERVREEEIRTCNFDKMEKL